MSEPDPVVTLLTQIDRPVTPSPEFAQALRTRLPAELAAPAGAPERPLARGPRLMLPPRRRRSVLAAAGALAAAAAVITAVFVPRPSPATALEVIQQARQAFAAAPPFQATLRFNLNP